MLTDQESKKGSPRSESGKPGGATSSSSPSQASAGMPLFLQRDGSAQSEDYQPDSSEDQQPVAHELTHGVQQDSQESSGTHRQEEADAEAIPEGTRVYKIGIVYKKDGANFRTDKGGEPEFLLPFNTKLVVISLSSDGWSYVGLETGEVGYVASNRIWTHLPEPGAKLHLIEAGETAQQIARKHYGDHSTNWGMDERFFVNVLVSVNKGDGDSSKGIFKPTRGDAWDKTQTRANYLIWIPNVNYAISLRGSVKSGSISYDAMQSLPVGQGVKDIMEAVVLSKKYLKERIVERIKETIYNVLIALALFIVGAIAILAVSTIIGAAIGALFGGVGAGPGAAIGFEVGLYIIKWLGLALLVVWIISSLWRIGSAFWNFLSSAWNAGGDRKKIEGSAYEFADAIAITISVLLEALVFLALAYGIPKLGAKVGNTRFGRWIGESRLGRWLADRLALKGMRPPAREMPVVEPYGEMAGTLPEGVQAHHLNQNAAYRSVIPKNEGIAVGARGNAFTEPGSQHYEAHRSLEIFWGPFRRGGARYGEKPTNGEYSQALNRSLRDGGYTAEEAAFLEAAARANREQFGLSDTDLVPNIPGRLPQRRPTPSGSSSGGANAE